MDQQSHISEKSATKSAFAPIRPSASAIERAKAAATEAKAKQELPAPISRTSHTPPGKSKEIFLPGSVQIGVEVVTRPDRNVFVWAFVTGPRQASIGRIGVAINLDHWLVKKGLLTQDTALIAYMIGMCLGECLTYRARKTPWLPTLLEQLRELLFKDQDEGLKNLVGVQFLGGQLAQTAAFKKASADLLAPGGAEPGKKHLVATIRLGKEGGQP
jgi:hypothetical protein